ncbi:hypothetical protein KUL152_08510 [Tenacibaculum sp. KUL152]|nr:hypothetical protein KUL152_08510 [Tenacibaculum sp. KUL152]
MSMLDKELQDAYKQSQQRHALNSDMKQRILQHNALHRTQSDWGISIEKFIALFDSPAFKFSAVAFALIVMFGVYNVGKWQTQRMDTQGTGDLVVSIVNYHGFEGEGAQYRTDKHRAKFNTYTQNYYASRSLAQAVSVQGATLYADDGNWLLINCKDEQVVVSEGLLASLNTLKRIEGDIKIGTQVALAFDAQGKILGIRPATKSLMC